MPELLDQHLRLLPSLLLQRVHALRMQVSPLLVPAPAGRAADLLLPETMHSEPSDSPFNTSDADLIYSINVVNFQWTVFISDFMHMRDKTVCGF